MCDYAKQYHTIPINLPGRATNFPDLNGLVSNSCLTHLYKHCPKKTVTCGKANDSFIDVSPRIKIEEVMKEVSVEGRSN